MPHNLYLVLLWVHILAACVWVGGMAFLAIILVPALRKLPDRGIALALIQSTGRRFKIGGWIALVVLMLTGITNVSGLFGSMTLMFDGAFWAGPAGRTLAVKLCLVAITLTISATHDFVVGPKAVAAMRSGSPESAESLRRAASWMGRANFLIALAIVLCGVLIARGGFT